MDVELWRSVTDPLFCASGVAIVVAVLVAIVAVRLFTAERKR